MSSKLDSQSSQLVMQYKTFNRRGCSTIHTGVIHLLLLVEITRYMKSDSLHYYLEYDKPIWRVGDSYIQRSAVFQLVNNIEREGKELY